VKVPGDGHLENDRAIVGGNARRAAAYMRRKLLLKNQIGVIEIIWQIAQSANQGRRTGGGSKVMVEKKWGKKKSRYDSHFKKAH